MKISILFLKIHLYSSVNLHSVQCMSAKFGLIKIFFRKYMNLCQFQAATEVIEGMFQLGLIGLCHGQHFLSHKRNYNS